MIPDFRDPPAIFRPDLTPKQMLHLGVFGGAYFPKEDRAEFPADWFAGAKVSDVFDAKLNLFGVAAGQSMDVWVAKGWIRPVDPLGWFQWYCRYYEGRRCDDDERQIKRHKNFLRHVGMLRHNAKGDPARAYVHRQALLQWGYDPFADLEDELSTMQKIAKYLPGAKGL